MNYLLTTVSKDLIKVINGNRAAAKRVRTGTVKLAKIAKLFRKESVAAEKSGQLKRKPKGVKAVRKKGAKKAVRKKK